MFAPERLVILDADGTTINAFTAIETAFTVNGMDIGNLERFQKRHQIFKYLGGIKEFPKNLRKQISKKKRKKLINTLTEVYREEAVLYDGMADMISRLQKAPHVRVGIVTRNITHQPRETLRRLFQRNQVDTDRFNFLHHLPLRENKISRFRKIRSRFKINPALAFACGDEFKDYTAAIGSGINSLMVSYGFENFTRLSKKYGVPGEIISHSPEELSMRLLQAVDL
ncbi:MAG TPA: HAD family hydrolase [Desulfobulbaceae bacterium]|nr:HAD family hydrolase [Desulfobulbaceae bacterium]